MDLVIDIKALTPDELHGAAALLAHGMRDNPVHEKVFGTDPGHRERRLLRFLGPVVAYVHSQGALLGAYVQGELVGVLGMMEPGGCRPDLMDALRFVSVIATSNSPARALRILRWLAAWARNDPARPHYHIGPMAVRPAYRRRGIGRRLMTLCCQRMDALGATAYLETDLAINVDFYKALGFLVIKHELVLGVPNWFMSRPPSYCYFSGREPHERNLAKSTRSLTFASGLVVPAETAHRNICQIKLGRQAGYF